MFESLAVMLKKHTMKGLTIVQILLLILFTNCTQKPNDKSENLATMKDYFNETGEIFLKLYKKSNNEIEYWETWNTDRKTALIHYGQLGQRGQTKEIKAFSNSKLKKKVNTFISEKLEENYKEIPFEEQFTVVITFKLDNWGAEKDLERREEIRNILTEHLGWTGNGICDDAEIGSGEMSLFADVIDPYLATKTIIQEFKDKEVNEIPYFTIMQGDNVIEQDYKIK